MQANISLIFNLLLLAGVIYAIFRMLRKQPTIEVTDKIAVCSKNIERDDIIAIRKITPERTSISLDKFHTDETSSKCEKSVGHRKLFFLVPNKQAQFQGYELLQSLLAAKLRFGEDNFFHYYQQQNSITESVFTVTATTETGEFDLNQIQTFSTRGLCLFIEPKSEESTMKEAQAILLKTSSKLCQLLDAILLDETQKPMSTVAISDSIETGKMI